MERQTRASRALALSVLLFLALGASGWMSDASSAGAVQVTPVAPAPTTAVTGPTVGVAPTSPAVANPTAAVAPTSPAAASPTVAAVATSCGSGAHGSRDAGRRCRDGHDHDRRRGGRGEHRHDRRHGGGVAHGSGDGGGRGPDGHGHDGRHGGGDGHGHDARHGGGHEHARAHVHAAADAHDSAGHEHGSGDRDAHRAAAAPAAAQVSTYMAGVAPQLQYYNGPNAQYPTEWYLQRHLSNPSQFTMYRTEPLGLCNTYYYQFQGVYYCYTAGAAAAVPDYVAPGMAVIPPSVLGPGALPPGMTVGVVPGMVGGVVQTGTGYAVQSAWANVPPQQQYYYGPNYQYDDDWYVQRHLSYPSLYRVYSYDPAGQCGSYYYRWQDRFFCYTGGSVNAQTPALLAPPPRGDGGSAPVVCVPVLLEQRGPELLVLLRGRLPVRRRVVRSAPPR